MNDAEHRRRGRETSENQVRKEDQTHAYAHTYYTYTPAYTRQHLKHTRPPQTRAHARTHAHTYIRTCTQITHTCKRTYTYTHASLLVSVCVRTCRGHPLLSRSPASAARRRNQNRSELINNEGTAKPEPQTDNRQYTLKKSNKKKRKTPTGCILHDYCRHVDGLDCVITIIRKCSPAPSLLLRCHPEQHCAGPKRGTRQENLRTQPARPPPPPPGQKNRSDTGRQTRRGGSGIGSTHGTAYE